MEQRPFKSPLPTQTAFTNLNGFGVEVTIKFHFTLKATWSLEWCDNRLPTGPGDRKSHLWQSCLKGWLQPTMKLHPLRFKLKSYKWNFMWWLHLLVLGTHLALQLSKHFSRQHLCQMHYGPNDPTLIMEGAPHTSHWTLPIWSANSLKALGCKVTQSADLTHYPQRFQLLMDWKGHLTSNLAHSSNSS